MLLMLMHEDQDAVLHHHTIPVACHVLEGESAVATLYRIVRRKNILTQEIVVSPLTLLAPSLSTLQCACHLM